MVGGAHEIGDLSVKVCREDESNLSDAINALGNVGDVKVGDPLTKSGFRDDLQAIGIECVAVCK